MTLTKETLPLPLSLTVRTKDSSSPLVGSVKVRKAWCGRFAVVPSTVVRSIFSESVAPSDTVFARGLVALSLRSLSIIVLKLQGLKCTHLVLAAPPTPAPLLAIPTVASSKLHAAADAIDAPESKSEDTKPKETFMIGVCKGVNAELLGVARRTACAAAAVDLP